MSRKNAFTEVIVIETMPAKEFTKEEQEKWNAEKRQKFALDQELAKELSNDDRGSQ